VKTIVILSHVTFDNSPYCSYVHEHAKALVKQGYHVVVFAIVHWFPILSHFQKYKKNFMKKLYKEDTHQMIDGVEVIYLKSLSLSNFLYYSPMNINGYFYYQSIKKQFKKLLKSHDIVYVDAHTFKIEGYVAYQLKKKYPHIFTTVTLHGTSFEKNTTNPNGIKLIKKIFNVVDYGICVSYKLQNKLNSLNIKNSKVIFNGINQLERKNIEKEKYLYNIITVGALNPYKNHDLSIDAISELKKKYPFIHLNIVGVGKEKDKLVQLVEDLELKEHVTFKNQLINKEVLTLMNESYIFLLPSIHEGFGIVYPEAMSMGCITIGTKTEGIDGFIKDKENGFLVNPNVKEIVQLIDEIYSKKYNIQEIRKRACQDAQKLTWENNAKQYIEVMKKNN
jgi:glycosyltransferase involved in cell wall biosynthesis